ncbi:MAG: hypothetical protein IPO63_03640 [Bacteroidetes bacterium]|nr:hypothetical protein [Bacteroidota bacterium]
MSWWVGELVGWWVGGLVVLWFCGFVILIASMRSHEGRTGSSRKMLRSFTQKLSRSEELLGSI